MKAVILALCLFLVLLVGCSPLDGFVGGTEGAIVPVHVTDSGISVGVSKIEINNMSAGREASVIYRVYNDTDDEIMPEIFTEFNINPQDYPDAAEYERAPDVMREWIIIPDATSIKPRGTADITVKLSIPDNVKGAAGKWTYRIGAFGGTGGKVQTAASVWWLINMR